MQMKRENIINKPGHRPSGIQLFLAALAAFCWLNSSWAQEVYTWTDQDGVTHFSDVPPETGNSQQMQIEQAYRPGSTSAYPSADATPEGASDGIDEILDESPQTVADQRREQIAQAREKRREEEAIAAQLCPKYRQRLEQMEPARRVFYTNEQGEQVRMDDDERVAMIEEAKEYIAKNCR
jgi:hypothetical protein